MAIDPEVIDDAAVALNVAGLIGSVALALFFRRAHELSIMRSLEWFSWMLGVSFALPLLTFTLGWAHATPLGIASRFVLDVGIYQLLWRLSRDVNGNGA